MILNLAVAKALAKAQLVLSVDAARPAADLFKINPILNGLVTTGAADLASENVTTMSTEGGRTGAVGINRACLTLIEQALWAGHHGIGGILSKTLLPTGISDADRLEVYTTYGWAKGELGRFSDDRVLLLAALAVHGEETISNPAWRYAPELVDLIEAQLAIIEAEAPDATTGNREVEVSSRVTLLDLLETYLSRVRYHYCGASNDLDRTPELARIGFQPRRKRGAATPTPAATPAATPTSPAPLANP